MKQIPDFLQSQPVWIKENPEFLQSKPVEIVENPEFLSSKPAVLGLLVSMFLLISTWRYSI